MAGVLDDAEIGRVLCITAHPGDVDFVAAGTVAPTEAGTAWSAPARSGATPGSGSATPGLSDGRLAEGFRVLDTG